jgi:hypothetical protein
MNAAKSAWLPTLAVVSTLWVGSFASAADAGSVPKLTGPPHGIGADFFGVNIENVYLSPAPSWTDPALQNAIGAVGIQNVRFPGGDAGNYWDWQNGTMYPLGGSANVEDSLGSVLNLTQATGVSPLYNLNVMTYDNSLVSSSTLSAAISDQLAMLQTAGSLGLPVQKLELGNEFFWSGADHDRAFPTAKDYATTMNVWTKALRAEYPTARIAAVASIPYKLDARTKSWNGPVLAEIRGVDAMTLHRYDSIIDGGMYDGTPADAVLSYAFSDWAKILSGEVEPIEKKKLQVWVTEFGGFADCTSNAEFTGTWLEGLYQTQMAIQFLSRASVSQIQLYNITGSTSSLVFQDSSSYWDGCQTKTITFNATPGDLTATGQAYALIGGALKGATAVAGVSFPEAPVIKPRGGVPSYPSATGVALTGASNQWILTNYAASPLTLSYPGMGTGMIESLSSNGLTTIVNSQGVLTLTTGEFNGASFVLPAYSVNWIVAQ